MSHDLFDWVTEGFTMGEREAYARAVESAVQLRPLARPGIDPDELLFEAAEVLVAVAGVHCPAVAALAA